MVTTTLGLEQRPQADAADAQTPEGADNALDLIERQPVFRDLEAAESLRHAIAAAQVTAIRDRQADVFYGSTEGVDELRVHSLSLAGIRQRNNTTFCGGMPLTGVKARPCGREKLLNREGRQGREVSSGK